MLPPPFLPVPCNHSLTGFKLVWKNATHLRRRVWVPSLNVVHWGHPFEMTRYTKVTLLWRGCVKPGHHAMSLVWVDAIYREVFCEIKEMKIEKEPQHNLCAAINSHLDGGMYCDSASSRKLHEILTLHDLLTLPCL